MDLTDKIGGEPDQGAAFDRSEGMEHRHLTVMFVDLVGSTRLSETLPGETFFRLNTAYQEVAERCTKRFAGSMVRVVGDGILILFGWPHAHEDDPERAARTALAIHQELALVRIADGVTLRCRIGIATGDVLVGNVDSGGLNQPGSVYGPVPNLAARLQQLVGAGETVVAEETCRRIQGVFSCADLGAKEFNGFKAALGAFWLVGEADRGIDCSSGPVRRRLPLIGRRDEMDLLMDKWACVQAGDGQTVVLIGDAGMGKSRLLEAQRHRDDLGTCSSLVYYCSPFHQQSAFHPFIDHFKRWCGFRRNDPPETRIEKMRSRTGHILNDADIQLLAAQAVPGSRLPQPEMSREAFMARVETIYLTLLRALARFGPVMIHFEDVHWIDPASRALLEALIVQLTDQPILLVLSQRPDALPDLAAGAQVTRLELPPLGPQDASEMIEAGLEGAETDSTQMRDILALTNGVPLYIAEYTASVAQASRADLDPEKAGRRPIPGRVSDLLTERLDMLGPLKTIALAAAVIGRPFDLALLSAVLEEPEAAIGPAVATLCQRGIFEPVSRRAGNFTFCHALVRERAYDGLIGPAACNWHRRVAKAMLRVTPEAERNAPDILAYHCEKGELPDQAIRYWTTAASSAFKRFAFGEALNHVDRARPMLDAVPPGDRMAFALRIESLAGRAAAALQGYGAPKSINAFDEAFNLATTLGDPAQMLGAGHGLFTGYQVLADYARASDIGRRIASRMLDPQAQMWAHYMMGVPLIWRGKFGEGRAALDIADRNRREAGSQLNAASLDLANQIHSMQALTMAFMGEEDAAIALAQRCIATAELRNQPLQLANVVMIGCNTHTVLHHPDGLALAERLSALADEHKLPFYQASATSLLAAALLHAGEAQQGYDLLQTGWRAFQATVSRANQVLACTELARGCLLLGRLEEGVSIAAEGLERSSRYDERNFEAELRRIQGELLARQGRVEEARHAFSAAIDLAQEQKAKVFESRAAVALRDL
ncbi:MAG: adenylate/guanylate cyclase domain-containing protein [Pseudomonadota bacterium]